MIIITGATGNLGRLVINELIKVMSVKHIVALVRSVKKADNLVKMGVQIRKADYDQPSTLITAFTGASKILLISSNKLGHRVVQHQSVINAAIKAGIKLLVYTSILQADTNPIMLAEEHRSTEKLLWESNLPVVLLRNGWYSENYSPLILQALKSKEFFGAANTGLISSASRIDYASAAVKVLTNNGPPGKIYELAGDESWTMSELAEKIGVYINQKVKYINLTKQTYQQKLIQSGISPSMSMMLADSDDCIAKGALFNNSHQLSRLIGRPTIPIYNVITDVIKEFKV